MPGTSWDIVRRMRQAAAVAVMAVSLASGGWAVARPRPHFEPTDLDLEDTGIVELDLQFGMVRGPDAWRTVIPDFELDLGLTPNVELGLDGAYAIEGRAGETFSFDHPAPDSLWASVKVGLWDSREERVADTAGTAWALGVAVGPKLPVTAAARGVGFEALALLGRSARRAHVVLNAGGFFEPRPDVTTARPAGFEGGVDLSWDATERLHLVAEVAGVRFLSADPHQAAVTAGASWSMTDAVDVSLVALAGFTRGADRAAVLVGLAPKLRLFGS